MVARANSSAVGAARRIGAVARTLLALGHLARTSSPIRSAHVADFVTPPVRSIRQTQLWPDTHLPLALQVVLVCLLLLTPARGNAQSLCETRVKPWVANCAATRAMPMEIRHCLPTQIVITVSPQGALPIDLEVGYATDASFTREGQVGVSPVGEFADWSAEPLPRRDALDAVLECVRKDPSLLSAIGSDRSRDDSAPTAPLPWALIGAVIVGVVILWRGRVQGGGRSQGVNWRQRAIRGEGRPGVIALAVVSGMTFVGRMLCLPCGFFHQNGQGPLWIRFAIHDTAGVSPYGPGYAEVLHWVARTFPSKPDLAVFGAVSVISALVPTIGWIVVRRATGSPWIAWCSAILLAAHPLAGRLAQSESYFAVILALLWIAALFLSRPPKMSRGVFALRVFGAALIAVQAARVHPVAWIPILTIPIVGAVGKGRWTERVRFAVLSAVGVYCVVLIGAGETVWAVLQGTLGAEWQSRSHLAIDVPGWPIITGLLVLSVLGLRSRNRFAAIGWALATFAILAVSGSSNLLRANYVWVSHAYGLLFAPALVPCATAGIHTVCTTLARPWRRYSLALLCVGLLFVGIGPYWREYTVVPTDAVEANWALTWRRALPSDAALLYLSRAGDRLLMLPLYDNGDVRAVPFQATQVPLLSPGGTLIYYRSSLCSSSEGRRACDEVEGRLHLEPIEVRHLKAAPSHPWQLLDGDLVRVGLYRVRSDG